MGLLLQTTNIIRDYREDCDDQRFFWPMEICGKYEFKEIEEMSKPGNKEWASLAQSGMILDALRHATDALDYLRLLKNQSVFNFCAIPATMVMATLELCFTNKDMFQRNIKIRKAAAANVRSLFFPVRKLYNLCVLQLIMASTNPRDVAYMFRDYARGIHSKAILSDPNFIHIAIACGKIEQWCERHYPSFINIRERFR